MNLYYKQYIVPKTEPIQVAQFVFVNTIELHDFA